MQITAPSRPAVPSFDLDMPEDLYVRINQASFLGSHDAAAWLAEHPRATEQQFSEFVAGQVGAPPTGDAAQVDRDEVAAAIKARTPERTAIARALDRSEGLTRTWGDATRAAGAAQAEAGAGLLRAATRLALDISWELKQAHDRPRPFRAFPDLHTLPGMNPADPSFVSGHAAYSAAAAATLGDRAPALRKQFEDLAAQISYSRVYAALHFPTDVVGGAYVGGAAAAFAAARQLAA